MTHPLSEYIGDIADALAAAAMGRPSPNAILISERTYQRLIRSAMRKRKFRRWRARRKAMLRTLTQVAR